VNPLRGMGVSSRVTCHVAETTLGESRSQPHGCPFERKGSAELVLRRGTGARLARDVFFFARSIFLKPYTLLLEMTFQLLLVSLLIVVVPFPLP
jgi:hypothetical protein